MERLTISVRGTIISLLFFHQIQKYCLHTLIQFLLISPLLDFQTLVGVTFFE